MTSLMTSHNNTTFDNITHLSQLTYLHIKRGEIFISLLMLRYFSFTFLCRTLYNMKYNCNITHDGSPVHTHQRRPVYTVSESIARTDDANL